MGTWSSIEPGIDVDVTDYWDTGVSHVFVDVATERNWSDRIRLISGETWDVRSEAVLTPAQVRVLIDMLEQALSLR